MSSDGMVKQKIRQDVWLDLLCWESIIRIVFFFRSNKITVYYCQVSVLFMPLQRIFQRLAGVSFIQINDFVQGDERINGISAYEAVHNKLRTVLQGAEKRWAGNKGITDFAMSNGFNMSKIRKHIKERGGYLLFRPVEIGIIADIRKKEKRCFAFKMTPLSPILKDTFSDDTVLFYRVLFSQYFRVNRRSDNYYDKLASQIYYSSNLKTFLRVAAKWVRTLINVTLLKICAIEKAREDFYQAKIGVEQLQSRHRQDDINDLYWFEDSQINPNNVVVLERGDVDLESRQEFAKMGVKRVKIKMNPLHLMKNIFLRRKEAEASAFIEADNAFLYESMLIILKCVKHIFVWNEANWIVFQLSDYKYSTLYWLSVLKQLNIRIFWSMLDMDDDKLSKAQAVEMFNGIYAGSHWSIYPLIDFPCDKRYDVFFVWGEHFQKNVFCDNHYLGVFIAGYPSDHYFVKLVKRSEKLRKKYDGKFVLSYLDNGMGSDLPFSMNMQINLHKMLLSLLEENNHIVLFLKPKRKYVFEKIIKTLPRISDFIKTGRIVTFFGDTWRTKAVPAMVGMASDLVVGLGISTAVAECHFSGTLAFHADLTNFKNNNFANQGLGKIVFRDVEGLKTAIQNIVDNGIGDKYLKYKELYNILDPFQDGQAYKRVGFVLRNLQELLSQGHNREEAAKIAMDRYDDHVQTTARLN